MSWFSDWTPNQKFLISMVVVVGLLGAVLPYNVWVELLGFSQNYMDRDEVWQAIEDYIDQDIGGSPYQTEKPVTYQVGLVDVTGTVYAYMLNGDSGVLLDYSTDHDDVINWAMSNATEGGIVKLGNGTFVLDNPINYTYSYTRLIGEARGVTFLQMTDTTMNITEGYGTSNSVRLQGCSLEDITLEYSTAGTAGAGIWLKWADRFKIHRVQISDAYIGTYLWNMQFSYIEELIIDSYREAGMWITVSDNDASAQTVVTLLECYGWLAQNKSCVVFERQPGANQPNLNWVFINPHLANKVPSWGGQDWGWEAGFMVLYPGTSDTVVFDCGIYNPEFELRTAFNISGATRSFHIYGGWLDGQNANGSAVVTMAGANADVHVHGGIWGAVDAGTVFVEASGSHITTYNIQSGANNVESGGARILDSRYYVTENWGNKVVANDEWSTHGLDPQVGAQYHNVTVLVTVRTCTYGTPPVPVVASACNINATHIKFCVYWVNGTAITDDAIEIWWMAKVEPNL